jgi:hypothetical protein
MLNHFPCVFVQFSTEPEEIISGTLFPPQCVRVFLYLRQLYALSCSREVLHCSSVFLIGGRYVGASSLSVPSLSPPFSYLLLLGQTREGERRPVSSCTKLSVKAFLSILLKTEGLFRPLRSPFFYFLVIATWNDNTNENKIVVLIRCGTHHYTTPSPPLFLLYVSYK